MTYKTINVSPATYEKLLFFKHGRMTFDDVLNRIMDQVEEEQFYREVLKEHKKILKEMEAGDYVELKDLRKALEE